MHVRSTYTFTLHVTTVVFTYTFTQNRHIYTIKVYLLVYKLHTIQHITFTMHLCGRILGLYVYTCGQGYNLTLFNADRQWSMRVRLSKYTQVIKLLATLSQRTLCPQTTDHIDQESLVRTFVVVEWCVLNWRSSSVVGYA